MILTEAMKQALLNSIQAEQNAHDFYQAAAEKVQHDVLRELFSKLAVEELGHRDFLKNLLEDKSAVETIKPQKVDYHLAEEVIEEKPELTVDMPFSDAIALAIKREEEAMMSYEVMAGDTDDEELRQLFINLRNMEQSHKTSLETVYMDVAYAEVW